MAGKVSLKVRTDCLREDRDGRVGFPCYDSGPEPIFYIYRSQLEWLLSVFSLDIDKTKTIWLGFHSKPSKELICAYFRILTDNKSIYFHIEDNKFCIEHSPLSKLLRKTFGASGTFYLEVWYE